MVHHRKSERCASREKMRWLERTRERLGQDGNSKLESERYVTPFLRKVAHLNKADGCDSAEEQLH